MPLPKKKNGGGGGCCWCKPRCGPDAGQGAEADGGVDTGGADGGGGGGNHGGHGGDGGGGGWGGGDGGGGGGGGGGWWGWDVDVLASFGDIPYEGDAPGWGGDIWGMRAEHDWGSNILLRTICITSRTHITRIIQGHLGSHLYHTGMPPISTNMHPKD